MIKRIFFSVVMLVILSKVAAQQPNIDSLKNELQRYGNDTFQLVQLGSLANAYAEINPDSAFHYGEKMLVIAKDLHLRLEEVVALNEMGYALLNLGNYPRSLQTLLSSISLVNDPKIERNLLPSRYPASDDYTNRENPAIMQRWGVLSRAYQFTGILYINSGNYDKALHYLREAITLSEKVNNLPLLCINNISQGRAYILNKQPDSALMSLQRAYDYAKRANYHRYLGSILLNMCRVYQALGKPDSASVYIRKALFESTDHEYTRGVVACNLLLADMFRKSGLPDSSLHYIQSGLASASKLNAPDLFLRSYRALAEYYQNAGNSDSTVKYQSLIIKINDSLFNSKQVQQFQNIDFDAQQQQQEIEAARKDYQNRLRIYLLLGGMATFLLVAIMLLRVNHQRRKSNALLQQQKEELEVAMKNLKSAQSRLVQSEKMASLGELTAGIAHEIQNPLNFVNNFSDLNQELIAELTSEIDRGNTHEAKIIAENISENESKINLHGRRADAIVKGMLLHSQSGTGQMELININAMAEEYLRMTYHGLKLKDKSFNATINTDLDPEIKNIKLIPQDISRVLLNLFNNAFYAASERYRSEGEKFTPIVSLTTKKYKDYVEIIVEDNGSGIPASIKDKIFQPFFTTKPTGQGTGLGLSLSYDIVKAHGGELKVETKEGEGSRFIIQLTN